MLGAVCDVLTVRTRGKCLRINGIAREIKVFSIPSIQDSLWNWLLKKMYCWKKVLQRYYQCLEMYVMFWMWERDVISKDKWEVKVFSIPSIQVSLRVVIEKKMYCWIKYCRDITSVRRCMWCFECKNERLFLRINDLAKEIKVLSIPSLMMKVVVNVTLFSPIFQK